MLLLGPRTDDGEGRSALRSRPGRLELAEVRPAVEGRDIGTSELVRLRPLGPPDLYDVDVLFGDADRPAVAHGGPPYVASDAYRESWERIFGSAIPGGAEDLPN